MFRFIRNTYYTMTSKYFIVRSKMVRYTEEEKLLHHGIAGECTESKYLYVNPETRELEWVDFANHAHLVGFFIGAFAVIMLRRKKKYSEYDFSLESYGDARLMSKILNNIDI